MDGTRQRPRPVARRSSLQGTAGAHPLMEQPTKASAFAGFFAELHRRRVVRIVIVYAIAGWVVIEVAATMLPGLNLPDWTVTFVIALVVLGFPIAVIMGWMFDLGPRGAERTIERSEEHTPGAATLPRSAALPGPPPTPPPPL